MTSTKTQPIDGIISGFLGQPAATTTDRQTVLEAAREDARKWVWCQGWSPLEGVFGRPMPELGYPGEVQYNLAGACSSELKHRDSGCKNVTTRALLPQQIEEVAARILEARQTRHAAEKPHRDKWAAVNAYFGGRCNCGMVEIGNDLVHAVRSSDGAAVVVELIGGQWIARPPKTGERIYA